MRLECQCKDLFIGWLRNFNINSSEVAKGKGYSAKVDIWSTGCLVLEMLTGHQPWHKVPGNVIYFLGKGQSPPVPAELGELAQNFIKLCFTADPEKRPTATELVMDHFVQIDPTAFDFREWYDAAVESKVNQESESSYSDSSEDESYDSNDDKDNSVSDEKSTEIREDESDDYDDDIVTGYGENFDDQGEQDDIVTGYEGEEVDTLTGGHEAEIIEALRMQRDDEDESDN